MEKKHERLRRRVSDPTIVLLEFALFIPGSVGNITLVVTTMLELLDGRAYWESILTLIPASAIGFYVANNLLDDISARMNR